MGPIKAWQLAKLGIWTDNLPSLRKCCVKEVMNALPTFCKQCSKIVAVHFSNLKKMAISSHSPEAQLTSPRWPLQEGRLCKD